LKNAGEDILAMFFTVEYDFDSMSIDLSGRNFAKIIAKNSGVSCAPSLGSGLKAVCSVSLVANEQRQFPGSAGNIG
jgi:hypothetical protein